MQKGKVGALLAGPLGGKADRGYFTGRAWERSTPRQTQLGGQPFQTKCKGDPRLSAKRQHARVSKWEF